MSDTPNEKWARFQQRYTWFKTIGLGLDFSRCSMPDDYADRMSDATERALAEMRALEGGAMANADEARMVGHYWLRNPSLAPTPEIRRAIEGTVDSIKVFATEVHSGLIRGHEGTFTNILLLGIGGSALGPQFVSHALSHPRRDKLAISFMDNTDPDGFERVLARLNGNLGRTLCIVISKSGGTKETRNAMIEVEAAYAAANVPFGPHAVAVTSEASELAIYADRGQWLRRFPMWDWVGGRTSELSAVGLLPAALQGFDIDGLLRGASEADNVTRSLTVRENPALLLATAVHYIGKGLGEKAMVVLPYKDRLELFSRYLQQLIMESLGKERSRDGEEIHQGLTVFGNKGSTDQHAYVQQLRDGLANFFGLFIWAMEDQERPSLQVEPEVTSGDYLTGFLLGTREALFERGRESVLLSLLRVDEFHIGVLIALFERFVGFYASLINVNAYHQPGVEAGKRAASRVIEIQKAALSFFAKERGRFFSIQEIALVLGGFDNWDTVFRVCEHLARNGRISARMVEIPSEARFGII